MGARRPVPVGIDPPGKNVRALQLGFEGLDALSLMRKVTALSPAEAERQRDAWYLLFGLFCGAIISAFTYNLVIYTGHRYPFQRWYLIWAGLALLYGLSWTTWPRSSGRVSSGPARCARTCCWSGC